jgi:alpha-L-fucosidase
MKTPFITALLCVVLPLFCCLGQSVAQAQSKSIPNTSSETPVPEYQHASPAAYEAFQDLKYGIRIHWGIYTLARSKFGNPDGGESWMFRPLSFEQKQAYQELYKTFNPTGFDGEEWARLFADNGMKMFAITSKHHEGFSLFDTKTHVKQRINWTAPGGPAIEDCDLAYSVMDTPFHRDIIKELCDAGHRHGLAIDLYFSHPDWYDADFRPYGYDPKFYPEAIKNTDYGANPTQLATTQRLMAVLYSNAPIPTQAEQDRMMARHRRQLTELLSNYGKIDMVCLDIQLGDRVWPQLRETMLELRKLQPDVMFRNRGIGQYGDYETPERVIPGTKKEGSRPWFVIYPLAKNFDYDDNADDYKGGDWIIRSLVDSVAKGGNFMLGVGPDASGRFHPKTIENIRTAGTWLKVNGEGIYATRAREGDLWHEGDEIRYTQSKDHRTIYAYSLHFPGKMMTFKTVEPMAGSGVYLFGYDKPLTWTYSPTAGTVIQMPEDLQDPAKQKDFFVCGFKIQPKH